MNDTKRNTKLGCRFMSRVKSIERLPKGTRFTLEQNVHVVGQERPAVVYELVFIYQ